MRYILLLLISGIALLNMSFISAQIHLTIDKIAETKYQATITIAIKPQDFIDKDSIQVSIDHPDVQLVTWHIISPITRQYDPTCRETRSVILNSCSLSLEFNCPFDQVLSKTWLHLGYYLDRQKNMVHEQIQLALPKQASPIETSLDTTGKIETQVPLIISKNKPQTATTWSSYFSKIVEKTESIGIRLLLALLLGFLMSLTPCLYPMIPITVGILQAQNSSSFLRNLAISLAYTCGIATTFAALGLTAALTGQIFGSLMSNPFFIIFIVAILAYLGFSMLGFYNMYVPRSMRGATSAKGGSIMTAFLFGAASGTVASPCLSPGLILLLSIVATLGSKFLGFLLLFVFGVGLSLPLLIIGTFSTSLMLLPRAGMWMTEIKKLFGFLLFGMCFYFLQTILPWPLLLGLASVALSASGIFYLQSITPHDSKTWRSIKNIGGIIFIASSLFVGVETFQATQRIPETLASSFWLTDYNQARTLAAYEKTYLFIDIGAPYCSICKVIDKTIFAHSRVIEALKRYVPVKLDSVENADTLKELQQKYTIQGVPTFLLITPTGELIKRWGSEIYYDLSIDQFIEQLSQI